MNWIMQKNKIVELVNKGNFSDAFINCQKLLNLNLSTDQKAFIFFEMGMCKAQIGEYNLAEDYVIKSLNWKELNVAIDLLKTLYALNPDIPNEVKYLEQFYQANPNSDILKYKLMLQYLKLRRYKDMVAIKSSDKLLESSTFCRALSIAYLNMHDTTNSVKLYEKLIKRIEENKVKKEELSSCIEEVRTTLFHASYEEIYSDDEILKIIDILYNNTEHKNNKVNIDTSFFKELKIGMISSDIKRHPVGLFLLSLFTNHKKNNSISYVIYDTKGNSDQITELVKNNVDQFIRVDHLTDEELEQFILKDQLDILIELNSFSANNRMKVIRNRVAPIQISWIGFPTTTALPNIDYVILDKITAMRDYEDKFYTEKIIRMNHTSLCYALSTKVVKEAPPFLKNGFITFGSFSNGLKFSKRILHCWSEILKRVPNAKLFIMSLSLDVEYKKEALIKLLVDAGICLEQVILQKSVDYEIYFQKYNEIDLILDTYPFNGGTTTAEALSFGVPVLCLYGKHHVSRVGLSMLTNVGYRDLAVETEEAYINKAVELAYDKEKLYVIHQNLREDARNSPLCNHKMFQTEFENRLRSVYVDYCIDHRNNENDKHANLEEIKTAIFFLEHLNEDYKTKEEYLLFMQKLREISREVQELFFEYMEGRDFVAKDTYEYFKNDINKLNDKMSRKKLYEYIVYLMNTYVSIF